MEGPHPRCTQHHGSATPQPDPTPVKPNAISSHLSSVQADRNETVDFSLLPRPENSETRLLVLGGTGHVSLTDGATGDVFSLTYDAKVFPFVMLWISNKGRSAAPWSGGHLALGIEPVCAAFDLGTSVSTMENPLRAKGYDTAYEFKSDQCFHTRYQICLLYTSPSPRDLSTSRMPSSA